MVGTSGSGKSSVVAAGLLPSLKAGLLPGSERWRQATMRPGEHPMLELRRALGTDGDDPLARASADGVERLVLVVDQFEETFTTCADEDERARFVAALTGPAARTPERVAVVLAIRGDYYAHCASYRDLAETLIGRGWTIVLASDERVAGLAQDFPAERRIGLSAATWRPGDPIGMPGTAMPFTAGLSASSFLMSAAGT